MKRIATSISFKAVVATVVSIGFVVYPELRVSSTRVVYAATDLKSESQYKTEASRYDSAIRAIAGIANMKLDTPDDLKKAIAILDRERPSLGLHFSKLVVLAISDSTFYGAAKKRVSNKQAAEALAKELDADPRAILKLDGADALLTRVQKSSEADAAILRRVAEGLKDAAEKIKKVSQTRKAPTITPADEFKLIGVGFNAPLPLVSRPEPVIITVIALAIAVTLLIGLVFEVTELVIKLFIKADALAKCQEKADDQLIACAAEADRLPFPANITSKALCEAEWLARSAACLLLP